MLSVLNKLKRGFTLVELLVVISIIGILVAVATANLITAQKQARDSRRMTDLQAIQTAFETYFSTHQTYPLDAAIDTAFDSGLRPTDPQGNSYSWLTEEGSYCVCGVMESKPGNAADVGSTASCNWQSSGPYFCVQNRQ